MKDSREFSMYSYDISGSGICHKIAQHISGLNLLGIILVMLRPWSESFHCTGFGDRTACRLTYIIFDQYIT